jgi:hypothetical protein
MNGSLARQLSRKPLQTQLCQVSENSHLPTSGASVGSVPVPWLKAAHERAATSHERAAAAHDRAAEQSDVRGHLLLASRERERARRHRDQALVERQLAQLRGEWIDRSRARGARLPGDR